MKKINKKKERIKLEKLSMFIENGIQNKIYFLETQIFLNEGV